MGYKSYATGLVHYQTIRHNHDSKALKKTTSLFDPPRSALHQSIIRIGKVMQRHTDVFHVETVLDDNRFPWYLSGSGADASHGLVQEAPGEDLVLLPEVSPQLAPPVDFLGPARARDSSDWCR